MDTNGALVGTYTYDPFGKTSGVTPAAAGTATTVTNGNPLRYTGGYLDSETGLYKLGARYYNPQIGRFTQPDPSGQEANTYLYAGGDSVDYTDPSGQSFGDFVRNATAFHDAYNATVDAFSSDTKKLIADAVGVGTAVAVDTGCNFVLGAAAAPTAGASELGEYFCWVDAEYMTNPASLNTVSGYMRSGPSAAFIQMKGSQVLSQPVAGSSVDAFSDVWNACS
nr:RHS repeat-associated core domain-containing protein [Motilibacter rhizosphaerae]